MPNPFAFIWKGFKAFGHLFEKLFGAQQTKDFIAASEKLLESALGDIAKEAVAEAQATLIGATTGEKHDFAFKKIIADAEAKGIETKDSIVNLLIELAVQAIKDHSA